MNFWPIRLLIAFILLPINPTSIQIPQWSHTKIWYKDSELATVNYQMTIAVFFILFLGTDYEKGRGLKDDGNDVDTGVNGETSSHSDYEDLDECDDEIDTENEDEQVNGNTSYVVPGEIVESLKASLLKDIRVDMDARINEKHKQLEEEHLKKMTELKTNQRELDAERENMTHDILHQLLEKLPPEIVKQYLYES